ncbi:uncharacterized protein MELLADRAFT_102115 [Melampsora larici-populina 98AG31]|uniref:Uncharacterized protein n=1 Tax=Melampsora larici-populina (strain 98AG31 / pathotype 3-4-7) TaxID=747676 RepID=F4R622_MELLP|nr:uncharacterized protein MELLADRAFT_102115 [Melampsora larici-populina 98AG31]EGG12159.1 hypothetical protein MELLADRAFT_102115 [Melampsora larici-populina 98AG31]
MPHKRAKASIRKELSFQKGNDLPPNKLGTRPPKKKSSIGTPTSSTNHGIKDMPKNMYRILNSEKIREEYKARMKEKDQKSKDESSRNGLLKKSKSDQLRIESGERLSDFNQRVEQSMRPKLSSVMKLARNKTITKKPKTKSNPNESKPTEEPIIHQTTKEFEPKPTKFSLNDIVMEPPMNLKKPCKKLLSTESYKKLPISNSQKIRIEEEREKAVKRYRQLKEERLRNGEMNLEV